MFVSTLQPPFDSFTIKVDIFLIESFPSRLPIMMGNRVSWGVLERIYFYTGEHQEQSAILLNRYRSILPRLLP